MASLALFGYPSTTLFKCARCAFRSSKLSSKTTRRWIGLKYLAKVAEAEKEWAKQATAIRSGEKKSMLTILEERGLVEQITGNREAIDALMINKRIGAYVGIDPTASSLHIGHMVPLMALFWMFVHGFHTVSLLGGATAKIGDPAGRLTSREKIHASIQTANMANIHYQLKRIWINVEQYGRKHGYLWEWAWHRELANNNAWLNKLPLLEVLQVLGPGMRVGAMLKKDTVKNKLEKGDGMSWSEFTYPLVQAWDWWHMYHTKGIQMQIGGSDQYGNIVAGIDAVKYISAHHPNPVVREAHSKPSDMPVGFTVPLLTTSSGEKFGKSAGNAIWLDKEKTTTFDLYGYFMRLPDADVGRYLRLFTFLPIAEIDTVVKEHMEAPHLRKAHHLLAYEFVELVHGKPEALKAQSQHATFFGKHDGSPPSVSVREADISAEEGPGKAGAKPPAITLNNAPNPNLKLPSSLIHKASIGKILRAVGLADSNSDGHRQVAAGSIYIGGMPGQKKALNGAALSWTPLKLWQVEETAKFLADGKILLLRKGKHNVRMVEVVPDEEYKASGLTYPGQKEFEQSEMSKSLGE